LVLLLDRGRDVVGDGGQARDRAAQPLLLARLRDLLSEQIDDRLWPSPCDQRGRSRQGMERRVSGRGGDPQRRNGGTVLDGGEQPLAQGAGSFRFRGSHIEYILVDEALSRQSAARSERSIVAGPT